MVSNAIKFSAVNTVISVHVTTVTKKTQNALALDDASDDGGNFEVPPNGSGETSPAPRKGSLREGTEADGADLTTTYMRVSVTDSGPGISHDNQKKLFKEVVQFDANKLQGGGGSGFGLFISKGNTSNK